MSNYYVDEICKHINRWADGDNSQFHVKGNITVSLKNDCAIILLIKYAYGDIPYFNIPVNSSVLKRYDMPEPLNESFFIFEGDKLYIIKPLFKSHWSEKYALRDAREFAHIVLMRGAE